MAEKRPFDSIIDAFLADREPDWKDLGLEEAQKSGEEQQDRTHQHVDKEFMDDIAESASRHTPIWGEKAGSRTLEERLREKEASAPRIGAVVDGWHKDAYRRMDEYKSKHGDDVSLFDEVTESLESAGKGADFAENSAAKREISDAQAQKYVRDLLNQGEAPAKVAQQLEKLADLELFNHQQATDYLQRNAGMLGLAYIEPNTYMDKDDPNYRHDKSDPYSYKTAAGSNDCVRQQAAWQRAGVKPHGRSVKQVKACAGCSYFAKDAAGKTCNLYHLPLVANVEELSQIVNNLTPGVPMKQKHAALVQIANRSDERAQQFDAAKTAQTSVSKVPDTHVHKQAARTGPKAAEFTSSHLAKLHEKGVSLKDAYKWADRKFGSVQTSVAFRGFVSSLRKNERGMVVVAKADLEFLNSIGIRSERFAGAEKCASCEKHFGRDARPMGPGNSMRVDGSFAQRTASVAASQRKEAEEFSVTAKDVRLMHQKGHSLERIYTVIAKKAGSPEAKRVVGEYLANLKKVPGRIQVSASDRGFLGRAGFSAEQMRTTESVRPVQDKVVTPYKQASGPTKDGNAVLADWDLSRAPEQADIDIAGPDRLEVEGGGTFKVELE